MARFEITENIGPEVINSWRGPISTDPLLNYSEVIDVRHYTIHSYQIINESSNNINFNIYVSNYIDSNRGYSLDFSKHWTPIHADSISANSNVVYCDIWNFRYACIHLQGSGGSQVNLFEKHNV